MHEATIERIDAHFRAHEDGFRAAFLALLGDLVRERTVNVVESRLSRFPYLTVRGEETRAARVVRAWAEAEGFRAERHARIPERENVLLRWGSGHAPVLFVPGHMDVVPPGDGWTVDPFALTVRGDTALGRGVADNKGPLAAALLALKLVRDAGVKLRGSWIVGAMADEECVGEDGLDYGMDYLLERGLLKADCAIVPDIGGGMNDIDIAEKGRVVYRVTATGKQAHGSTPEKGINAITGMAAWLERLAAHTFPHREHLILGAYTVNVGEIRGGEAPNVVPGCCEAVIDMRLVPGQSAAEVREAMLRLAEGLAPSFAVDIQAEAPPHEVDPTMPLVRTVQDVTHRLLGLRPRTMGLGGGTYAKVLNRHGIPAVGFGPGDSAVMHMADESASIAEHLDFVRVLAACAAELLGADE